MKLASPLAIASPALSTSNDRAFEALTGWRDRGDQSAASRLVHELSPLMHHVAARSLPFPWMAEDAVQTAWMKFFRSLDSFDPRTPLAAWVVLILKRVCANALRGLSRQRLVAFDELPEPVSEVAAAMPVEDQQESREILNRVLDAISRLPVTDRVIVDSLLLDDLPAAEVARRTGLKAGAVRTRACRIRSHLRSMDQRARTSSLHEPAA